MRKIHCLEVFEEAIQKRAESEFGDGVEVIERMQTAKINCAKLGVVVQRLCEITPMHGKSVYRRLVAFFSLSPDLESEINKRRDSDKHCGQLSDRCEHFPVHNAYCRCVSRGVIPSAFSIAAGSYTFPPLITVVILLMSWMFFVGSPSTRIMSASFPAAMTPRSLFTPITRAGVHVAARKTSAGAIPARV